MLGPKSEFKIKLDIFTVLGDLFKEEMLSVGAYFTL